MSLFFSEIIEDADVVREMNRHPELNAEGKAIAEYILKTGDYPQMVSGILPLFVLSNLAEHVMALNSARGISHEITVATLKDINIWIENYKKCSGTIGLAEFHWLIFHYTGRLFRLGRLQFRLIVSPSFVPEGVFAIETHIPQAEPLTISSCNRSFAGAKDFFATYFPAFKATYFVCDSWLLNPALQQLLPAESNLAQFPGLWAPCPMEADHSAQAIERVFGFGTTRETLATAPESTSLQKALKQYLLDGNELNITAGIRRI